MPFKRLWQAVWLAYLVFAAVIAAGMAFLAVAGAQHIGPFAISIFLGTLIGIPVLMPYLVSLVLERISWVNKARQGNVTGELRVAIRSLLFIVFNLVVGVGFIVFSIPQVAASAEDRTTLAIVGVFIAPLILSTLGKLAWGIVGGVGAAFGQDLYHRAKGSDKKESDK